MIGVPPPGEPAQVALIGQGWGSSDVAAPVHEVAAPPPDLVLAAGRVRLDDLPPAIRIREGQASLVWTGGVGPRIHLCDCPPGTVVFAEGLPDLCELVCRGAVAVDEVAFDEAAPGLLADAVETWLGGIGRSLPAPLDHPGRRVDIGVVDPSMVAEAGAVVACSGFRWLASGRGLSLLGVAPAGDHPVPVSDALWWTMIDTAGVSERPVMTTVDVAAAGGLAVAVRQAHGLIGDALGELDRLAALDASVAARTSEVRTGAELGASLDRMESVLAFTPRAGTESVSFDAVLGALVTMGRLETLPPGKAGDDILAYAESRGLVPRPVTLHPDWWRSDGGRMLAFMSRARTPVALCPDWRGRYWIRGLSGPALRLTRDRAAEIHADAHVLVEPLPARPIHVGDLLVIAARVCRLELGLFLSATLLATLLGLALPLATGILVDLLIPDHLQSEVWLLGGGLIVLGICNVIAHVAMDATRLRMDGRLGVLLQAGMLDRALKLPSRYIRAQSSADLASRLMSVEQVRRMISNLLLNSVLTSVLGLSGFALLFALNARAALVGLGFLALSLVGACLIGWWQLRPSDNSEVLSVNLASLVLQIVQNVMVLKSFGAEPRAFAVWAKALSVIRGRSLRSRLGNVAYEGTSALLQAAALAAVIVTLAGSGAETHPPTGVILAFFGTFQGILGHTDVLSRAILQVVAALPMIRRANQLIAVAPETPPGSIDPGPLKGEIEFAGVRFAYPGASRPLLDDISFRLSPGEFVAIVGPSGSGKSTIAALMMGFETPLAGTILFDGQDLSRLERRAVRRQLGVVRQDSKIFAGSIAENILGPNPGHLDAAWSAAEIAAIAADIRALPMGMSTMLTDEARTLSGGQAQRILLARAIASQPRILILDEATSALDTIAQAAVTGNVGALGVTRVVIAHRLSTVQRADRIFVLQAGRIVQSGSFAELIRQPGPFHSLARRQLL